MILENNKLTSDENMTLTNGEVFSKELYLGCNDSPDNWSEITDIEAIVLQNEKSKFEEW